MTTAALPAPKAPVVVLVPPGKIDASPSNPRKTFAGIGELAEDVKLRGVLQPILLRPKGERFEIVFGERRWRACKTAKLEAVPAFVREMTDEEALEVQLVENSKREDIHPLEEADGYRVLHEKYKRSVEEIAAKVGKSRSAVYERIKLCAPVPAAREAFLGGKLSASTALLVARIPDKELQAKATKDLVSGNGGDPMPYRAAVDFVQRAYMLQLRDAPFSTAAVDLVPKAGACTTCPKRTGNQAELFADVKSPDVCTDPGCYKEKVDALWQIRVSQAKETGQEVLDEKKSKEIFKYGHLDYASGLRDLQDEEWVDGKSKKVKAIVGKEVQPILARDQHGRIRELVKRDVVQKAIRDKAGGGAGDHAKELREQQKSNEEHALRSARAERLLRDVVAKVEKHQSKTAWFILAEALVGDEVDYGGELDELIAHRLGHPSRDGGDKDEAELHTLLSKMTQDQLVGFIFEISLRRGDTFHKLVRGEKSAINELARALGIDEKKVTERVKAELKHEEQLKKEAEAPAPAPKKKAAAKKPAKAKK